MNIYAIKLPDFFDYYPIGIDIEKIHETDFIDLSKRCFTQEEQFYMRNKSDDEIRNRFFNLWTMKESYIKMTGKGLLIQKAFY